MLSLLTLLCAVCPAYSSISLTRLTSPAGVRREGGIVPYGKVHIVDRYILLRLIESEECRDYCATI